MQYYTIFPTSHYTQQSQSHYYHTQKYLPSLHNPLLSTGQTLPNLYQSAFFVSLPPQYYGNSANHSNMLHTPNWFHSTVNIHQKNSEAAAIASLSNFLQKQQADSVSSYKKLMTTNPSDLGGMTAAAAAAK